MSRGSRRDFVHGVAAAVGAVALSRGGIGAVLAQAAGEVAPSEGEAMAGIAQRYMNDYGVPGLAVAIARHGSMSQSHLSYVQGFGVADPNTGEPVTPAHLFRIASVSKPITSVAIFTLIERGRLRLSDRVFGRDGILVDDYGGAASGRYIEEITVEHLLTHTCGGWPNDRRDPMFSNPQMNHHQLIEWTLRHLPLMNPPGTVHAYSNFGFCVLGRVIEKVSGRPYADFVHDAVLRRCGITTMRIGGNTLAQRGRGEVVYAGQDRNPYGMNVTRMDSHGGWIASASDLVRFLMHVDGRAETPILRPDALAAMTAPSPVNRGYARGWAVNARNTWWHNGSLPGTSSIMVRTQRGFCWAALANSRRPHPDSVGALDQMMWAMIGAVKGWSA